MHITGERRIPAPRERVWRALADPRVLADCLPEVQVEPEGEGGAMRLRQADAAPVHVQPSIREFYGTLGWKIDPERPASQMVLIRLLEEGVFTRLRYELSLADPDGRPALDEAAWRVRIDQALGRFIQVVAGPAEIGAGGLAGAVQAATDPSGQPTARIGGAPIGSGLALGSLLNPSVIGGALFLLVLLFIVGVF